MNGKENARRRLRRRTRLLIEAIEPRVLLSSVPAGFTETQIATGLTSPTAIEIAPDGRVFAAQQDGTIRILKNDQLLPTPFATLNSEVDSTNERGLLGITLDPNFATNHYIYVYYTANAPASHNRLARLVANGDTMQPGSEVTLVDFPDIGTAIWHMGGAIHFGPDGKLYVGVGDHQQQDKSQQLDSVFGKVLRFNPDGTIPSDNPFYNTTTGVFRSIWCYGLRNPFTFSFQPGTGTLYINDVGNNSWEEINQGVKGGNYGWPTTEGLFNQATYPNFIEPIYTYSHSVGQCVAGAAFYSPMVTKFPAQYLGKFFFVDFASGWMKTIDPTTHVVTDFGTGLSFPTDAHVAPDGAIYFLERGMETGVPTAGTGSVHKLDYLLNVAPTIAQQPADQSGAVGQQVTFSLSASGTSPLSYQWYRGAQLIPGATSSSYTRTIIAGDNNVDFKCVVGNAINSVTSDGATLHVLPGTPPVPVILTPTAGQKWSAGTLINFSGSAFDIEDLDLPASAFTWQVDNINGNVSRPLMAPTSGITSGSFLVPASSPYTATSVAFRIILKVTDSDGVTTTVTRDILPNTSQTTFSTNVPGLSVLLNGSPSPTPFAVDGVVNLLRDVEAPATQTINNQTYQFISWSDGGARKHQINWPATNQTFVATYAPVTTTYLSDLTPTSSSNGLGPYEKDKSNGQAASGDGATITLNGQPYTKGLGVNAASTLVYNLNGQYSQFLSDIGVDDEVGTAGSVIFRVYFDNAVNPAFDSGTMTGATATIAINLDVTGVNQLRLVVTDAGNGNANDHADWAGARVNSLGVPPSMPIFAPPVGYPTGSEAHGVTSVDLNKDGKLDLVVANAGASTVSVLFGNGDGTFQPAASYAVGNTPKSVIVKDFNGDGKLDLATPNQGAATVSVLLNKGDNTFLPKIDYTGTSGAHELTSADVDGDLDLDIIEAGWGTPLVRVLFNNGSGVFSTGTNYTIGAAPHSVVSFDFNGDTKPDIAVADHDSSNIAVLLNNGNGTFANPVFYATGSLPHSLRGADLNGDSRIDLVTANEGSNNLSVFFGNANGSFAGAVNYATGQQPKGVAIGDVNSDGKLDLLSANVAGNYPSGNNAAGKTISVLLGNGNGTFGTATTYNTGHTPFSIALGDFDGDGDLDAATANWNSDDVTVLKNYTYTVAPANQPPTANPDSVAALVNQPIQIPVLANDTDTTGTIDASTVTIVTPPAHGVLNVDPVTGLITYAAAQNYTGPDQFTYTVKDDSAAISAPALVSISVSSNLPPIYLSDLNPTSSTNGWGSYERDRSNGEQGANDGRAIMLGTQTYARGLGVHANSDIIYNLAGGGYTQFLSDIGLDEEVGNNGSVIFRVYLDGAATPIYDSGLMTGATTTKQVVVDLTGKSTLRLVVNNNGGSDFDHADWANARLLQGASQSPTSPPASPPPSPPPPPPPPPSSGTTTLVSTLPLTVTSNGWGQPEKNRSNGEQGAADGKTITLNGQTYASGIGVHANSDISIALNGQYTQFLSDIGLDDEVGNNGSAIFRIYLDGATTPIYDSGTMTGATATKQVVVDVTGKTTLRLVVTDGGNGNTFDHGDWANARLVTGAPVTPPTAPTGLSGTYNTTTNKVDLAWTDASSSETGFRVERKLGTGGTWAAVTSALAAGTQSYTDPTALAASSTYYYRVFAYNAGGDSLPSNEFPITTPAAAVQVWLGDLNWTTATNGWGAAEKNRSNGEQGATDGKTISIRTSTYTKGLGVHANSDITYNIGGLYKTFNTDIGIDNETAGKGSVVFQIFLNGSSTAAYTSGTVRGTDAVIHVPTINVTGVQTLRLVVTNAGDGNDNDHADWAGAQLG